MDSVKKRTFGIGHLVKCGDPEIDEDAFPCGTAVSPERVQEAFDEDVEIHVDEECFKLFPDFDSQPDFVQHVVADMMFNLGYNRLKNFNKLKRAIDAREYNTAADEIEFNTCPRNPSWPYTESKFCRQTGRRCRKLAQMMRERTVAHGWTEDDINQNDCRCPLTDPLCDAIGGTCDEPKLESSSKKCPLDKESLYTGRCPTHPGKECCTATDNDCADNNGNCVADCKVYETQHIINTMGVLTAYA